jgi:hypothetical protein
MRFPPTSLSFYGWKIAATRAAIAETETQARQEQNPERHAYLTNYADFLHRMLAREQSEFEAYKTQRINELFRRRAL